MVFSECLHLRLNLSSVYVGTGILWPNAPVERFYLFVFLVQLQRAPIGVWINSAVRNTVTAQLLVPNVAVAEDFDLTTTAKIVSVGLLK